MVDVQVVLLVFATCEIVLTECAGVLFDVSQMCGCVFDVGCMCGDVGQQWFDVSWVSELVHNVVVCGARLTPSVSHTR